MRKVLRNIYILLVFFEFRCVAIIFIVRQICEKYLGKGKDVYFAFFNLEKAYDES